MHFPGQIQLHISSFNALRGTTSGNWCNFLSKSRKVSQFRLATSVYSHYYIILYHTISYYIHVAVDIPWRSLSPFWCWFSLYSRLPSLADFARIHPFKLLKASPNGEKITGRWLKKTSWKMMEFVNGFRMTSHFWKRKIKFMFQTTNQIIIIFLLLVYTLLTTIKFMFETITQITIEPRNIPGSHHYESTETGRSQQRLFSRRSSSNSYVCDVL